jgi:hypothetical protein
MAPTDLGTDESGKDRYEEGDSGHEGCIRSPEEIEGEISQA